MQTEQRIEEEISGLVEALVAGDSNYCLQEDDASKEVELENAYQQGTAIRVLRWVLGVDIRQETL